MREKLDHVRELRRSGENRAAIRACHEAIALHGPAFDAYFQLGTIHSELLEHAVAIGHFESALTFEPESADALCMLGVVLHDMGRAAESAAMCERAIRAKPDFPEAHFQLGLARFELADFPAAVESFDRCAALRRGEPWGADALPRAVPAGASADAGVDGAINRVKIDHDIEQIEYLMAQDLLPAAFDAVVADYRALRAEFHGSDENSMRPFDAVRHPHVAATYKKPLHIDRSGLPAGAVLSEDVDWRAIEESYLAGRPSMVTVDNLLAPQALDALRRFCKRSTVWNDIRTGYLGAYLYDGFACEAVLRVAAELRERLPRVVRGLPLQILWGYKYDSALPGVGIGVHADSAAINVNFWITEDAANLNPESGGLLVYSVNAPADWTFDKYNSDPGEILRHLQATGATAVKVPYRANRAVIFDSGLFHATDAPAFRDGYANRRINITLLYGLHGD